MIGGVLDQKLSHSLELSKFHERLLRASSDEAACQELVSETWSQVSQSSSLMGLSKKQFPSLSTEIERQASLNFNRIDCLEQLQLALSVRPSETVSRGDAPGGPAPPEGGVD
jgi:hypothetical protein